MVRGGRWNAVVVGCLGVLSLSWFLSVRPGEAADLTRGEKIYKTLCVQCHGEDGRGNGPRAKGLKKKAGDYTEPGFFDKYPDAELKKALVEGISPMPAYKGKLKDNDIDDVIAYIKTFAARSGKP